MRNNGNYWGSIVRAERKDQHLPDGTQRRNVKRKTQRVKNCPRSKASLDLRAIEERNLMGLKELLVAKIKFENF